LPEVQNGRDSNPHKQAHRPNHRCKIVFYVFRFFIRHDFTFLTFLKKLIFYYKNITTNVAENSILNDILHCLLHYLKQMGNVTW